MSTFLGPGSKEYMGKARSLVSNLKGNASLRQRVLSGELHPTALVAASAKELASEALKVQRQQSAERFASSRSLGSSSDRVVGWQAGTTGRIELPSEVDEVAEPSVAEPGDDTIDDTPAYRSLSAAPAAGPDEIACSVCTLINSATRTNCEVCESPLPQRVAARQQQARQGPVVLAARFDESPIRSTVPR